MNKEANDARHDNPHLINYSVPLFYENQMNARYLTPGLMHQDNTPLSSSSVENIKVGLVKEIKLIVCIMTHNLFKMTYFDKWSDIIPRRSRVQAVAWL